MRTGYAKTLKAFDASCSLKEDDIPRDASSVLTEESAPWRQEIRQDIIAGDILKAIAILETHCPANYNGRFMCFFVGTSKREIFHALILRFVSRRVGFL